MKPFGILALTDLHYIGKAAHICDLRDRKTNLALEFIRRVLKSKEIDSIDAIALLGDLIDNGEAPGAKEDLAAIAAELHAAGKPVLVVPGNHDARAEAVFDLFKDYEGLHVNNGCQIITFADTYEKGDFCTRSMVKMEKFFSNCTPGLPIITLQHNPIYPKIESPYPFNLVNAHEVMDYYRKNGVMLSVSGHAHWGIPLEIKDNVAYVTCPALCEAPYRYSVITVSRDGCKVTAYALSNEA